MKEKLIYIRKRFAGYISAFLSLHPFHYICIGISALFLGAGALFINSIPRLGETFRDLFDSVL